jgi:hypothetical protein
VVERRLNQNRSAQIHANPEQTTSLSPEGLEADCHDVNFVGLFCAIVGENSTFFWRDQNRPADRETPKNKGFSQFYDYPIRPIWPSQHPVKRPLTVLHKNPIEAGSSPSPWGKIAITWG